VIDTWRTTILSRDSNAATGTIAIALLSCLLIAACATTAPPPEPRYYRLPPAQPASRVDPPLVAALSVDRFRAGGPYAERPIVYVEPDAPLVLRGYHYHLWAVPPPELLQESLVAWLRETGVADRVIRAAGAPDNGLVTGRVLRLERESGEGGALAVVELELGYRPRASGAGEWSRIYRSTARPRGEDMHTLVEAFGVALGEVYVSYLKDLSRTLEKPE